MEQRIVSPEERLTLVQGLVSERGAVRIDELANDFGVSEMTIRRDLDELEALGLVRRVRGGAIAVGPEPFEERHRHNARAKARIADKLLEVIPTTGAVAFDASSTVFRLATVIGEARDLLIVTNGLDTFRTLAGTPGVDITLTGGTRDARTGSLVGPAAVRTAESMLYDFFVCSAAAIDPGVGSSETTIDDIAVKRAFSRNSGQVVLAADHTKLGNRARARGFAFEEIDLLVTDLAPPDDRLDPYRDTVKLL